MPYLNMYLTQTDATSLVQQLSEDEEIAFLVSDGLSRWRAVREYSVVGNFTVGLWHVSSGALPLLRATYGEPDGTISNPWDGWKEEHAGFDTSKPFFGAGAPGVIWLNLRPCGKEQASCCGLSSFEWIGNRYEKAAPSTNKYWKSLRKRLSKQAEKVPLQNLDSSWPIDAYAFPGALSLLKMGQSADLHF